MTASACFSKPYELPLTITIIADQDIGIAAWHETVGLFAWTSDFLGRSDTCAVTIGDDDGMTADCRFDSPQ